MQVSGSVFPKASQDLKVARSLMSPFDVIYFKFPCVNEIAKPVISYSKVKIFRCRLQKMMAGCRILGRHYLGHNLHIKAVLFRDLSTYIQFRRRVRRIALLVVMETYILYTSN